MAVEKKEIEIDALAITNKKQKVFMWETKDGSTFSLKKNAEKHDKKVTALEGFKMYFSEEKENLKIGSEALNKVVLPLLDDKESFYKDCFWIKIASSAEDSKMLKIFCTNFYKASSGERLTDEDDCSYEGWIYVVIVNLKSQYSNYWRWISLKELRKRVKIMENSFPNNDSSVGQLEDRDCLLDLD